MKCILDASDKRGQSAREYRWAAWVSLGILAIASIPYLVGWGVVPAGYRFIGLTHNVDDACVYLSWIRQAADGHFFARNLFTTEPQVGHGFNLLFLGLGVFTRITHLPPIAVFHLARVVFGFALLMAVYGFSGVWLKEVRSRRMALLVVGLSAGLGWLFPGMEGIERPVDLWQPEAITFLSIYLSPLFSFATLLIVGGLYFLYRFAAVGEWKYAVGAGLILMLLANVHTYDIITVALAWSVYCMYRVTCRPPDWRPIIGGALAAVIAAPSAAYQMYVYLNEPVFKARVAVPTMSPHILWYLAGFGLLIPLAILGIRRAVKERGEIGLLVCWAAAGLIAAYLPITFQRKLVMGTHIPLGLMAAIGLVALTEYVPARLKRVLPILILVLMLPTNLVFLARDTNRVLANEGHTTAHLPFISQDEVEALAYLRDHAKPDDVVLALPGLSSLIPGYTGLRVYCGHWGETAHFAHKLREVRRFYMRGGSDEDRYAFLAENQVAYLVGYHWETYADVPFVDFRLEPASYLTPVLEAGEVTVYRVKH